ncbi:MAG: hypothetical protein AABZ39_10645, partial [Spirochaetota bacterium]
VSLPSCILHRDVLGIDGSFAMLGVAGKYDGIPSGGADDHFSRLNDKRTGPQIDYLMERMTVRKGTPAAGRGELRTVEIDDSRMIHDGSIQSTADMVNERAFIAKDEDMPLPFRTMLFRFVIVTRLGFGGILLIGSRR